ncbi:MAG: hypothetical protein P4L57_14435 [Rhizomicrobium sp.]|nr:hypothetical protein [Rhizomicrobium sp.]
MKENSELAVLIGKMLGNVGLLYDEMKQVHAKVPSLKADLEAVAEGAAAKLAAAVSNAVKAAQAAGEIAGAEAAQKAASQQVMALVAEITLVVDEVRTTADKASRSLRLAVEKVSIWRQVVFCALSGAIAGLLICVLFLVFGAGPVRLPGTATVECPTGLGPDDCSTFQVGADLNRLWPYLPKSERDYLETFSTKIQ